MTITDEIVETAAIAGYLATVEKAPKYYAGIMLDRYVPWEEVSEEWRADYRATIRAALEAVVS